jgi:hypothetical protein
MRISFALAAALLSLLWAGPASAACAAFVCKNAKCSYQVQSSSGARILKLIHGERRIVRGLGAGATYCDWGDGCVTQRRAVKILTAC